MLKELLFIGLFISVISGLNGQSQSSKSFPLASAVMIGSVVNDYSSINEHLYFTEGVNVPVVDYYVVKVDCNGSPTGSVTITSITNGVGPYIVSGIGTDQTLSGTEPYTFDALYAGDYTVNVKGIDDTDTTFVLTVGQPAPLAVLNTIITPSSGNNGVIEYDPSGGTWPYTFDWDHNDYDGMEDIYGLLPESYTLTLTDNSGCTIVNTFDVPQSGVLDIPVLAWGIGCNGPNSGSIELTSITNGTSPYSITGIGPDLSVDGTSPVLFSDLPEGDYVIDIADAGGIDTTINVSLSNVGLITVVNTVITPSTGYDGVVMFDVVGGVLPYTFDWDHDDYDGIQDIYGLEATSYIVTITDAQGCIGIDTFDVPYSSGLGFILDLDSTSCGNSNSGQITISNIVNGLGPYTISGIGADESTNGSSPVVYSGLTAGDYSLQITDSGSKDTSFVVHIGTTSTISIANVNISPSAGYSGIITYDVLGGQAPYTYDWDHDAYDGLEDIYGLLPESYTVTVSDSLGCSFIQTFDVPLSDDLGISLYIYGSGCSDGNTGYVTIDLITNGVAPYTVEGLGASQTSDGTSQMVFPDLAAGDYTIHIVDSGVKDTSLDIHVTQLTPLYIQNEIVIGSSGSNGSIQYDVVGGVGPFQYFWVPSIYNGQEDISGLAPGSYSVLVQDIQGCSVAESFNVPNSGPLGVVMEVQDVNCNGENSGSIAINLIVNGTAPYTVNGQTTDGAPVVFSGLISGTYPIHITDSATADTTIIVQVLEPDLLQIINPIVVGSDGASGMIEYDVTGGTAPYSYDWNDDALDGQEDVYGLSPGMFMLTVTDANGCVVLDTFTVKESGHLGCVIKTQDIGCNGPNTGVISISLIVNGVAPYTVSGLGTSQETDGITPVVFSGLAAGYYPINITDSGSIDTTILVTIMTLDTLLIDNITIVPTNSNTGEIAYTVTGGVAPYSYDWDQNQYDGQEDLSGLVSDTYSVTVTDMQGCDITQVFYVPKDSIPYPNIQVIDVSCFGDSSGVIKITSIYGGSPNYTITGITDVTSDGLSSVEFAGLPVGDYVLVITDSNAIDTTLNITITSPTEIIYNDLVVNNEVTPPTNNGAISLNVSGGVSPYLYSWTNGVNTYMTEDLSGLVAGDYVLEVTDGIGCVKTFAPIHVGLDTFSCSIETTDVDCPSSLDGKMILTVEGSLAPYSYEWNKSGVTAIFSNEKDIDSLGVGIYTVTVTDSLGTQTMCFDTVQSESHLIIDSIVVLSDYGGFDVSGPFATNGEAIVYASGGVEPYTYLWSSGEDTQTATGLSAGSNTVTVTDDLGCSYEYVITMTSADEFTCFVDVVHTICPGSSEGAVSLTLAGGIMPVVDYSWEGPIGTHTEATWDNLPQGTYLVTVTDDAGNQATCSGDVMQLSNISVETQVLEFASSPTSTDGQAKVIASGGMPPYSILWSNGETTTFAVSLPAGPISVTVTDSKGCQDTDSFILGASQDSLMGSVLITNVSCYGLCDGTATVVNLSGGIAPYVYKWSNGESEPAVKDLCAGTYFVTITDVKDLTTVETVVIEEPDSLTLTYNLEEPSSYIAKNGSIEVLVTGGTPEYDYEWIYSGSKESLLDGIGVGTYTIQVIDANNCFKEGVATLALNNDDGCFQGSKVLTPSVLDGSNDAFLINCLGLASNTELLIFSRWGELVYESKDYVDGSWKGTDKSGNLLPEGAYFWILKYSIEGTTKETKGHVTILR